MRKNSLSKDQGLSMSQAQSLSNIINQEAESINQKIAEVNNFSSIIKVDGVEHSLMDGVKLNDDILSLLKKKANLHGFQAFLMENIKAKDKLLNDIKNSEFDSDEIKDLEYPSRGEYQYAKTLDSVNEEWGFEQLSVEELNDFYYNTAMASHIGQFIHKKGKLDVLRSELPNISGISWMEIESGKKTPVIIKKHHTIEDLTQIHVELANLHREYEQKVNYIKAKVKDLVNNKNAEIHKENQILLSGINEANKIVDEAFTVKYNEYRRKVSELEQTFEKEKAEKLKEVSKLRIVVDSRYETLADEYLVKEVK